MSTSTTRRTVSGLAIDLLHPAPNAIHIIDIAHGLALQCRFAGQIREFYSVAQHSVLVSQLVPREDALWGLLHDASEAYISDVPAPLKETPFLTGYRMVEAGLMNAVLKQFGMVCQYCDEPRSVRLADKVALATEFRDLCGWPTEAAESETGARPCAAHIEPVSWQAARRLFMDRFQEINSWRRAL
jgi:5'-deoxynucleotidase YfbR-like HD superfamily hydrolase